jgi:hypothetical protein
MSKVIMSNAEAKACVWITDDDGWLSPSCPPPENVQPIDMLLDPTDVAVTTFMFCPWCGKPIAERIPMSQWDD